MNSSVMRPTVFSLILYVIAVACNSKSEVNGSVKRQPNHEQYSRRHVQHSTCTIANVDIASTEDAYVVGITCRNAGPEYRLIPASLWLVERHDPSSRVFGFDPADPMVRLTSFPSLNKRSFSNASYELFPFPADSKLTFMKMKPHSTQTMQMTFLKTTRTIAIFENTDSIHISTSEFEIGAGFGLPDSLLKFDSVRTANYRQITRVVAYQVTPDTASAKRSQKAVRDYWIDRLNFWIHNASRSKPRRVRL